MTQQHIIHLLDSAPLASMSESEITMIRAHAEICVTCERAYEAAQLSALLIKERATEKIEPSQFFQTRVLAAVREQQADNRVPAFRRLWRSAGALVSSMAVTTAALAALSFLAPIQTPQETAVALSPYTTEAVVFDPNQSDEQMTYEQVLSTIYAVDDEGR